VTDSHVSRALGAYVPLVVLLVVYALTCLLGAIVLLVNYRPFVALWEYFSGTNAPRLSGSEILISVTLLVVPPLLMVCGYWLGTRIPVRIGVRPLPAGLRRRTSPVVAHAVFYVLAIIGIFSLARAGSFTKLDSWLSYQAWVDARWSAFAAMSFFEFVNLYTFVPLAAAWCAIVTPGRSVRRQLVRWAPLVIAILLALALFQKKAALISFILVLAAFLIDQARRDPRFVRRGVILGCVALVAAYFAMVVFPTFNLAVHSEPALQRARAALITPKPRTEPPGVTVISPAATTTPVVAPDAEEHATAPQVDPRIGVVMYSLLAPLMRTSAPALYYTIVFPDLHAFYGPDVGLDIVCSKRIGCSGLRMPDDNLVVWDYMNPVLHGGSVTAPFQFALYSQAGVPGAVVGSLLLGFVLAVAWRFARSGVLSPIMSSMWGAATVVLSINLALDSPRNSIIVSYGAMWAFLFIVLASLGTFLAAAVGQAALGK